MVFNCVYFTRVIGYIQMYNGANSISDHADKWDKLGLGLGLGLGEGRESRKVGAD